jgi:predicted small metal-binding protein
MAKELCCGDIVPGCDHVMRGETEDEVLMKAVDHARAVHGIEELDDATMEQVRAAISDV